MNRLRKAIMVCLLASLAAYSSGCYGNFNVTRRLHHWNGDVGGKWVNELVFLGLNFIPVYAFATLGDAIIFNSIEFWTGDNPVSPPHSHDDAAAMNKRVLQQGDHTVVLTRQEVAGTIQMLLTILKDGQRVEEVVLVANDRGEFVKQTPDGRVLARAQILEDGSVEIHDLVTQKATTYTHDDVMSTLVQRT